MKRILNQVISFKLSKHRIFAIFHFVHKISLTLFIVIIAIFQFDFYAGESTALRTVKSSSNITNGRNTVVFPQKKPAISHSIFHFLRLNGHLLLFLVNDFCKPQVEYYIETIIKMHNPAILCIAGLCITPIFTKSKLFIL